MSDLSTLPRPLFTAPAAVDYASIHRDLLLQRLQRVGKFSAWLGIAGGTLMTASFIWSSAAIGGLWFALNSPLMRSAMLYGVPMILVSVFAPLTVVGLVLSGRDVATAPVSGIRRRLIVVRAALIVGMLFSLLGVALGLMSSQGGTIFSIGVLSGCSFVAAALLATRVRDVLFDMTTAQATGTEKRFDLSEPRPVLPLNDDPDETVVQQPEVQQVEALQYAVNRIDGTRDFLRLFDLLAIFGCIVYALSIPVLLDSMISTVIVGRQSFVPTSATTSQFGLACLSALVAIGWAIWGALYVAFGPLMYRFCFVLGIGALVAASFQAAISLHNGNFFGGRELSISVQASILSALFPAVMLFCLTRVQVRAAFQDRREQAQARAQQSLGE